MKPYDKQEQYKQAKKEIKKIKSFYIHLLVYLIINVYMAIKTFIYHGLEEIKYSLIGFGLFWGIGLFFHWYRTFGRNLLFSKEWESRKIKEIMNKNT